MNAEFFDIFGFLILLIVGLKIRKREKTASWVVIAISLLGLAVDGYIVVKTFILGS